MFFFQVKRNIIFITKIKKIIENAVDLEKKYINGHDIKYV